MIIPKELIIELVKMGIGKLAPEEMQEICERFDYEAKNINNQIQKEHNFFEDIVEDGSNLID